MSNHQLELSFINTKSPKQIKLLRFHGELYQSFFVLRFLIFWAKDRVMVWYEQLYRSEHRWNDLMFGQHDKGLMSLLETQTILYQLKFTWKGLLMKLGERSGCCFAVVDIAF